MNGRRRDDRCECGGGVGNAEHLLLECKMAEAERGKADAASSLKGMK